MQLILDIVQSLALLYIGFRFSKFTYLQCELNRLQSELNNNEHNFMRSQCELNSTISKAISIKNTVETIPNARA